MKVSVFSVCMPEYDLAASVDLLARLGYDGVEWRLQRVDPARAGEPLSYWGNNRSTFDLATALDQAAAVAKMTRARGLDMPSLASYVPLADRANVAYVLQVAQALGVPQVRLTVPAYDRKRLYADLFAETRANLEAAARLAEKHGVRALVEIHMGTITPSAGLAHRLVDGLDPKWVGVIYDPGNMAYEGYEAWRMGLELLGPYLAHVHAKNALWQVKNVDAQGTTHWETVSAPLMRGIVDWAQVLVDLKAVGYDGWLSLEDFSTEQPTEAKLAADVAYLRALGA